MLDRRRKIALGIAVGVAVIGTIALVVLPEVVRRVAESRLAELTGRAVSIQDVDLNVFAGHVAVKRFRLAQADGKEAAVEFERLDVRVGLISLLTSHIRVREIVLAQPTIRVARTGPDTFDFSDILARLPASDPNAKSTRVVSIERLAVTQGTVLARDEAVTPAATWRVADLGVEVANVTTRPGVRPGRLEVGLTLNGSRIAVRDGGLALAPLAFSGRVSVAAFDLAATVPYTAPVLPAAPSAGRASLGLDVAFERGKAGIAKLRVGGDVAVEGLEVVQAGRSAPFVVLHRLAVAIKEADLVARAVTVASVEADGLDLRASRDAKGVIDLLALATSPTGARPAAAPPPAPEPSAAPPFQLRVVDIALRGAKASFRDEAVTPVTTLALTNLTAQVRDLTWPSAGPASLVVATRLPGGGRLDVKGRVTPAPLDLQIAMSLRGAPVEPYAAYIPINGTFAGRFNGDSQSRLRIVKGKITAVSKGTSWIDALEVRAPGETTPPVRVTQIRMDGIDFAWPEHAKVAKVTVTKPELQVARDADGTINLKTVFGPRRPAAAASTSSEPARPPEARPKTPPPAPKATPSGKTPASTKGSPLPLAVEIGQMVLDEGYARFLDRTTTPAFSETLSRLHVSVEGLSSEPGRRAKLETQAILGGDAALDLRGEIAPLGQLYADLAGELRNFALPAVNPYAESFIAWFLRSGKLTVNVRYQVEEEQLTANNEIVIENLRVAPSTQRDDEVKKRIGLPLGLIVALMTDSKNGIRFNVPISGPLSQWQVGLSDAIWAAIKNAVVNVIAGPFRAIGRMFKGEGGVEELTIDPVTFPAGSSVITPAMERHLTEIGDFLRRAPLIKLAVAPVSVPRDVESLKTQELIAHLQKLQRERGLKDFASAVRADLKERLPGVKPPEKPEDQLALLRAHQPLQPERLPELQARRLAAVREALAKGEGIPPDRLVVSKPAAPPSAPPATPPTPATPSATAAPPGATAPPAAPATPSAPTTPPGAQAAPPAAPATPPAPAAPSPAAQAGPPASPAPKAVPAAPPTTPAADKAPDTEQGRIEFSITQ